MDPGSRSGPVTHRCPDRCGTGEDTKCLEMEPMCQIMFYNQLPTSDTIPMWTLAPEVGRFHTGDISDVEPGHWGGHQVSGHETDVSNHVYSQLPTSDTIHKWTLAPMWNPDTGADTKFPAMEPMCQIIFYNQLQTSDTFHKWTLAPEVGRFDIGMEPLHWGGHQMSSNETYVSNHVL